MSDPTDPVSIDPDLLLARGAAIIELLCVNDIDPLTDPIDLLCITLLGMLVLRALGLEDEHLITEISRLTTIAELVNVQPLRQLIAERRAARGQDGTEGVPHV